MTSAHLSRDDRRVRLSNEQTHRRRHVCSVHLLRHRHSATGVRRFTLHAVLLGRIAIGLQGWLGSRVVSVLDSGAEGPGFKSQSRRCRVTVFGEQGTVHTHCAPVHQTAKLVAALLRVAGVTAGLAESNGSLPSGLRFTSPAG